MSDQELPNVTNAFKELGEALQKGLTEVGFQLSAQAALGWMLQGKIPESWKSLQGFDEHQLRAVSLAAFGVSQLCDDVLVERGLKP